MTRRRGDQPARSGRYGTRLARWRLPVGSANLVLILATALALVLRLYQLVRPGYLLGTPQYDDGVDLGSAIRLIDGFLPYRDFAFIQPPGITLLMAPVALLTKAIGTDAGLALARILTACAGAAGVTLAGLLVRHRGVLATTVVCGILAVHPDSVGTASTVFLEPWLVLFCLVGAVLVFDGDELTVGRKRVAWGGVAFGFAGAVKVWAVLPVLVLLVLACLRRQWRRAGAFAGGVIAGFGLPVLPFFLIAPRSFFDSVVTAQASRVDVARVPITSRLVSLLGIGDLSPGRTKIVAATVVVVTFALLCAIFASLLSRRMPPTLELFALGTAALVLTAFMWPPDYYFHYAAFFAPFLALSIGLPASRLITAWSARPREMTRRRASVATAGLAGVAAVASLVMAVVRIDQEATMATGGQPVAAERQIPAGACVLTDISSFTIAADRFSSSVAGCAPMVDSVGTDYALSGGRNAITGAGEVPAVKAVWLSAFKRAQYVWLNCAPPRASTCDEFTNRRIPWTAPILAYFSSHFRLLPRAPGFLYARVRGSSLHATAQPRRTTSNHPG